MKYVPFHGFVIEEVFQELKKEAESFDVSVVRWIEYLLTSRHMGLGSDDGMPRLLSKADLERVRRMGRE